MPLRVSWSYDESEKSHIKMSHKGHYAKVKKPTGPELYEDASRILDELLKKQISSGLKLHGGRRPPRFKTYPPQTKIVTTADVLDERDEDDMDNSGIERSKTMPSQIRGSSTKETHPSKETKFRRRDSFSSASSADTEGDSEIVSSSRKKKSLLKKVKEKFLRTVKREDREKQMMENNKQGADHSQKIKAANKGKSDRNGFKDLRKRGDKRRGDADSKNSSQSSHIDDASALRKNSVGMAFIKTIRRSFSSKKGRREYSMQDEFSAHGHDTRPLDDTTGSSKSQTPSPVKESSLPLPLPAKASSHPLTPPPPPPASSGGAILAIPSHEKSPSPYPKSSSTDSHRSNGDKSSSLLSMISAHRQMKHSIGAFGDDFRNIKYMDDSSDDDDDNDNDDDWGTDHLGRQGDGLPTVTDNYRSERDGRTPLRQQESLCVDGETEDDVYDGKGNLPLHERSEEEKGEMFGKIAQKLIDMGENYAAESGLSDSEHHPREARAQSGAESSDGLMSDLERQILECLRDVGDRNSEVLDQCAQEMMEETKAKTYDRFKQTMQHSLGEEISWNHLALLFYTSKGVMTAVGKGSIVARDVKEMTLRYFSDKFAKWIMDQGGFDGILSESDSELD